MPQLLDAERLNEIAAVLLDGRPLTKAEHDELLRVAQGFSCKDSAQAANVSTDTVKTRRKHIYRKLRTHGAPELVSSLLAIALRMLATPAPGARPATAGQPASGAPSIAHAE